MAVTAQLTWMVNRRRARGGMGQSLGLALGLLVGCKTSGTYSAVLLFGAAGFFHLVARREIPWRRPPVVDSGRSWSWRAPVCVRRHLAVRNTWLFGTPVEIVTDRYYGSILSELKSTYGGDWMYLLWRVKFKIRRSGSGLIS